MKLPFLSRSIHTHCILLYITHRTQLWLHRIVHQVIRSGLIKKKDMHGDTNLPLQPLELKTLASARGVGPSLMDSMVTAGGRSNSSCWIPRDTSDSFNALIRVWRKLNQEVKDNTCAPYDKWWLCCFSIGSLIW